MYLLTPKQKRRFFLLALLNFAVSITDIVSIAFLFVVINFYTPQTAESNTLFALPQFFGHYVFAPAILLVIIFLAKSFFGYYVYVLHYRFINNVASGLSSENIERYLGGTFTDYVYTDSAQFTRIISFYPIEFSHFILSGFLQMISEIILIVLIILALLLYNAKLLVIVAAVLVPAVIVLSYITKKRLSGIRKNIGTASEHTMQYLHEALTGYVESNVYGGNKRFSERYTASQSTVNNYVASLQIAQGMPARFFEAFAVIGLFLLIVAGLYGTAGTGTGILTLGAYMAAAYKIIPGISKIINFNSHVKTYAYAMEELVQLRQRVQPARKSLTGAKVHTITLQDVSFSFKSHLICNRFSHHFTRGTFTAVKGASGRGKTTLMNLVLGFLSPDAGSICINGKAMNAEELQQYWACIAYVKQEPFMLHDSILKNITLLEEDYDTQLLNEAIAGSGLLSLIKEFPEGVDQMITENGRNISGGQRQRIAIARALYKNADVIILDEPFNELDEKSEAQQMACFKQLAASGKIIILITHHNNNLEFCTDIILLDEQ